MATFGEIVVPDMVPEGRAGAATRGNVRRLVSGQGMADRRREDQRIPAQLQRGLSEIFSAALGEIVAPFVLGSLIVSVDGRQYRVGSVARTCPVKQDYVTRT